MKKILSLSSIALFLLTISHSAQAERQQLPIQGNTFDYSINVDADTQLELNNDYGDVVVRIVPRGDKMRVWGTYQSPSKLHADIQVLKKSGNRTKVFIDGPAQFKSHDHIAGYGKPLDIDFFRQNVGKIAGIERSSEEENGILVGGCVTLTPEGMSMSGHCVVWGSMSWGGDVSLEDGTCWGREPARATLNVEIPIGLVKLVKAAAEKPFQSTISFPNGQPEGSVVDRNADDPQQFDYFRADAACESRMRRK